MFHKSLQKFISTALEYIQDNFHFKHFWYQLHQHTLLFDDGIFIISLLLTMNPVYVGIYGIYILIFCHSLAISV